MTGIIADSMYELFVENNALPREQKECRRKNRGTKDQLLIDKMVFAEFKRKRKNLAMAWMAYEKACDVVPHSRNIESLKNGIGSDEYIIFSAEIYGKLEDRTDILWRVAWFSL